MADRETPRRAYDLAEVLILAAADLDAAATAEGVELPLPLRTRLVHWLARAYDAGRASREPQS